MDFQNNFEEYLNSKNQTENENMTEKEMKDLEEALNNSRASADFEQYQREFSRQAVEIQKTKYLYKSNTSPDIFDVPVQEKPFVAKQWRRPPKSPLSVPQVEAEISAQKEFIITFQDLPQSPGKLLDITYHNPIFDLPITTNPCYQRYSVKQRMGLLCDYYTKIDCLRSTFARGSLHRAPFPKPILPSNKCKNSLLKNGYDADNDKLDDFLDELPVHELYVSRAGRQIKRKIYTEPTEGDSDSDFASSIKKNKADDSDLKITLDSPFIGDNNTDEKTTPKSVKTKRDLPKQISLSTKKFSSRAEELFEKVKQNETKKKQEQKEIDEFEKTLPNLEGNDDDTWVMEENTSPLKDSEVDNDPSFIPQRVVPPIPKKKGGRPKKAASKQDADNKPTKPDSSELEDPGSPVLRRYKTAVKKTENKPKPKLKATKSKEEASTSQLKTSCPICSKEFLQSEIENHAANCGIEDDVIERPIGTNKNTMTCELCERDFSLDIYEQHVKKCIASKVTDL